MVKYIYHEMAVIDGDLLLYYSDERLVHNSSELFWDFMLFIEMGEDDYGISAICADKQLLWH